MNQSYQNSVGWPTAACGCYFPQTSLSSKLVTRVGEAGFEKAFDPPADSKCFYYAPSSQIGFNPSTLTAVIFEYLKNHQFDVSNWFFMAIFGRFHSGDAKRLFKISSVWNDCLDAVFFCEFVRGVTAKNLEHTESSTSKTNTSPGIKRVHSLNLYSIACSYVCPFVRFL